MDDNRNALDFRSFVLLLEEKLTRLEEKLSQRMEFCYHKFAQIDRLDERVKELEDIKKELRHWLFFVVASLILNLIGWLWVAKANGMLR